LGSNRDVEQTLELRTSPSMKLSRIQAEQPLVIIVDDGAAVREAVSELILSGTATSLLRVNP
jgi:hypothetical protein